MNPSLRSDSLPKCSGIAAQIVRNMHTHRERQDDLYRKRKFWWTLRRHFLALPLLASCMREFADTARLVLPARQFQSLGTVKAVKHKQE